MHAYTLIKKCEAKQSIVSESDRLGGLFSFVRKNRFLFKLYVCYCRGDLRSPELGCITAYKNEANTVRPYE